MYYYQILNPTIWKDALAQAYKEHPQESPKNLGELALQIYTSSGGKLAEIHSNKADHSGKAGQPGFLHRIANDLVDQYDTTHDQIVETLATARQVWNNSPKGGALQIIQDGGKVIKTVGPKALKSAMDLIKLLGTAEMVALPEEVAVADTAVGVEIAAAPEELAVAAILL